MNKCDFCQYSVVKFGKLTCPYFNCLLSQEQINQILDKITKKEIINNLVIER